MSENDRILVAKYTMPYAAKRGCREMLEHEIASWNKRSYKSITIINSALVENAAIPPPGPDVFETEGQIYECVKVVASALPYREFNVLAPRGRVVEYLNTIVPLPTGMKYIETRANDKESLHEAYARGVLFEDTTTTPHSLPFGVFKYFHPVPTETTSCAFVVMTRPHWRATGHATPTFSSKTIAIPFPDELRGDDDALMDYVKPKFVELATARGITVPDFFAYGARVANEKYVTFVAVVDGGDTYPEHRNYIADKYSHSRGYGDSKYDTRYSWDRSFRTFAQASDCHSLWADVELSLDDADTMVMTVYARRRTDPTLFDYQTPVLTRTDFTPYETAYDLYQFELHMRLCRSQPGRHIPEYYNDGYRKPSLTPEEFMKYYLDDIDVEDASWPAPFTCPATTREFDVMTTALKTVNDTPALYEFQKQTVRRLIRQEFSGDGILGALSNRISGDVGGVGFFADAKPYGNERVYKRMTDNGRALLCHRGGMVFDDPGMGKTRQAIYLVKATMLAERAIPPPDRGNARTGATLIIVKPNVLKQWENEIKAVWPDCRVGVWHGARKKKIVHTTMRTDYDIVLTTTSLVSKTNDDDPIRAPWCRVIIDEAHDMTNVLAGMHALSDRRWVMTGTPAGNGIGRMIQFTVGRVVMGLKHEPTHTRFRMFVIKRLATRKTLARHVQLPHVAITDVSVNMSNEERELHDAIVARVENPIAYTNVALLQIYNAVTNATTFGTYDRTLADPSIPSPTRWFVPSQHHEMVVDNELVVPDDATCPVCLDLPDDPCVTACDHWFCAECITMSIARNPRCPLCRTTISVSTTRKRGRDETDDATDATDATASVEPTEPVVPPGYIGTKTAEMLSYIENALETANRSVIVFFTTPTAVDTFAAQCTDRGIESTRIHGRISLVQRHNAFDAFQRGETRVLIATTKTMADGITLTRASDILIATPTGSVATDRQIVGRANRIGRDVTVPLRVTRFAYADSIERRYLDEQLSNHTGRANNTIASIFV